MSQRHKEEGRRVDNVSDIDIYVLVVVENALSLASCILRRKPFGSIANVLLAECGFRLVAIADGVAEMYGILSTLDFSQNGWTHLVVFVKLYIIIKIIIHLIMSRLLAAVYLGIDQVVILVRLFLFFVIFLQLL